MTFGFVGVFTNVQMQDLGNATCISINYLVNITMHCIALHCIVHGNYVFSLFSHLLTQVACKIKYNVLNLIYKKKYVNGLSGDDVYKDPRFFLRNQDAYFIQKQVFWFSS